MPNPLEDLVAAMSVRELAERSGRSVADIAVFALGGGAAPTKAAAPRATAYPNGAPAGQTSRPRGGMVNTRSVAGRHAYETAVLGVVREASGEVSAVEIRGAVGGTPMQARAALNRLIEDGKIKYSGRARSTKYFT